MSYGTELHSLHNFGIHAITTYRDRVFVPECKEHAVLALHVHCTKVQLSPEHLRPVVYRLEKTNHMTDQ